MTEPAKDTISAAPSRRSKRRQAILEAAAQVFFEAGYEGASIDAVIERVGGSKRTIYNEFGNKEGLFTEIVKENVRQATEALGSRGLGGGDLRSTFMDAGLRLMHMLMAPSVLALYRAVVHEGTRFPELAEIFWLNGPGAVIEHLAELLEEHRRRGELRIDDCRQAAGMFVELIRGNRHLLAVLGLRTPPAPEEIDALVAARVDIFLNGILAPH